MEPDEIDVSGRSLSRAEVSPEPLRCRRPGQHKANAKLVLTVHSRGQAGPGVQDAGRGLLAARRLCSGAPGPRSAQGHRCFLKLG